MRSHQLLSSFSVLLCEYQQQHAAKRSMNKQTDECEREMRSILLLQSPSLLAISKLFLSFNVIICCCKMMKKDFFSFASFIVRFFNLNFSFFASSRFYNKHHSSPCRRRALQLFPPRMCRSQTRERKRRKS